VWNWLQDALTPLRPLCDEWCLHVWEVAETWLAGFATLAAVLVSLSLARRERVQLRVSAGHRIVVGAGAAEPYPQFVIIRVRNPGARNAIVEGIGWRRRPWRKLHGYQTFGFGGPPADVNAGASREFFISLDDAELNWGGEFVRDFVGRWPRLAVRLIRVQAWTPAGDLFSAPLDSSLREWLVAKANSGVVPPI
jgi:hypothetical protein